MRVSQNRHDFNHACSAFISSSTGMQLTFKSFRTRIATSCNYISYAADFVYNFQFRQTDFQQRCFRFHQKLGEFHLSPYSLTNIIKIETTTNSPILFHGIHLLSVHMSIIFRQNSLRPYHQDKVISGCVAFPRKYLHKPITPASGFLSAPSTHLLYRFPSFQQLFCHDAGKSMFPHFGLQHLHHTEVNCAVCCLSLIHIQMCIRDSPYRYHFIKNRLRFLIQI